MRYAVAGRTVDTAATADNVGAALWNPASAISVFVREIHWFKVAATVDNPGIVRISARGTASTTVTPDADNAFNDKAAPASGALLDTAYSAQPTVTGPYMFRTNLAAVAGAGVIWTFYDEPIEVPAGQGLAVATPVAVLLQDSDVAFVWDE